MPTYDFACRKCGHEFQIEELLDEHAKRLPHACAKCKSTDTFQLFKSLFVMDSSLNDLPPPKEDFQPPEGMGYPPMGCGGMGGMGGMCGPGGF